MILGRQIESLVKNKTPKRLGNQVAGALAGLKDFSDAGRGNVELGNVDEVDRPGWLVAQGPLLVGAFPEIRFQLA